LIFRKNQFAVVENPGFWNWTFTLKDIDGKVLAEIDRDWRGFGFEVASFLIFFIYAFQNINIHCAVGFHAPFGLSFHSEVPFILKSRCFSAFFFFISS
jgi:hypothetical protein